MYFNALHWLELFIAVFVYINTCYIYIYIYKHTHTHSLLLTLSPSLHPYIPRLLNKSNTYTILQYMIYDIWYIIYYMWYMIYDICYIIFPLSIILNSSCNRWKFESRFQDFQRSFWCRWIWLSDWLTQAKPCAIFHVNNNNMCINNMCISMSIVYCLCLWLCVCMCVCA